MRKITSDEFATIMDSHQKWLTNQSGKRADLSQVDFTNPSWNFISNRMGLWNNYDFSKVIFSESNLTGCSFSHGLTTSMILNGADFTGCILEDVTFEEKCSVLTANFSKAKLQKCKMNNSVFSYSIFYEADLSEATLKDSRFFKCNFSHATLTEIKINDSTNFNGSNLSYCIIGNGIVETYLKDANFKNTTMSFARFDSVFFDRANFCNSIMDYIMTSFCKFSEANLAFTSLVGADLSTADMKDALLYKVRMVETKLPEYHDWRES